MATASYPIQTPPAGIQPVFRPLLNIAQSGTTVTVTLQPGAPDLTAVAQVGDVVSVQATGTTTWNGIHTIANVVGATQFTYTDSTSRSTSASVGGYVYFPYFAVSTTVPTGFVSGQDLVVAGADDSSFDGSFNCRGVSQPTHYLYQPLSTNPAEGALLSANGSDTIPTDTTFTAGQWETVIAAPHQLRTTGTVDGETILLDYVVADNFGLSIPTGATIVGVSTDVNFQSQATTTSYIAGVTLYSGGSPIGSVKNPNWNFTTFPQDLVLGGSGDTWGASLNTSTVNNANFGFGVQVQHNHLSGVSSNRLFINSFKITVYYVFSPTFSGNGTLTGNVAEPTAPVTASISVTPTTITQGGSASLTWVTTGADTATLITAGNDGTTVIEQVDLNKTRTVSPVVTTNYQLIASSATDSKIVDCTLTVNDITTGLPLTATFTASPSVLTSGGTSTLHWTTQSAVSVSIDQGIGSVSPVADGTTTVTPTVTTIYTLTATSATGKTIQKQAVVSLGPLPPTPTFNPKPYKLAAMSQGPPYIGMGITDQDTGTIYGATGRGTLALGAYGLALGAGRSGVVTDGHGTLWYVGHFNAEANIQFTKVKILPGTDPSYYNRSAWVMTANASGGSNTPDKAVDGDPATYWNSGGAEPAWIKADMQIAGAPLSGISIQVPTGIGATRLTDISVSSDDVSYTSVYSTATSISHGTTQYFQFPVQKCRYFKISIQLGFSNDSIAEIQAGIGFGGLSTVPSFDTSTQFSLSYEPSGVNSAFSLDEARYGYMYRPADDTILLSGSGTTVYLQVVDPIAQSLGTNVALPDSGGSDTKAYIAGMSTDNHACVFTGDHVYVYDTALSMVSRWSRSTIDPVHSLYAVINTAKWDSINSLLWAVTDDTTNVRLFKIDLTGPTVVNSVILGPSGGAPVGTDAWGIEIDNIHSTIVATKQGNITPDDDTLLHVIDQSTLAITTYALPNDGSNYGCMGNVAVTKDGLVYTQGYPPFFTAPVWAIDPTTGAVHSSAWEWGNNFDLQGDPDGLQYAFAYNSGYTAPSGVVNLTGLVIHINAGTVTAIAGPPPSPRSEPLEFGGYVLHIVPVSRI